MSYTINRLIADAGIDATGSIALTSIPPCT